jgi:hypothetical protein
MDDNKQYCINIINDLYEKNKSNQFVLNRIRHHLYQLPQQIEHEMKNYQENKNKTLLLSKEQEIFIQVFLEKNSYFYNSINNTFFEYNSKEFIVIKEDDITHKLLSTISKQKVLMNWKQKTKVDILKVIKDRNIFKCTPESETIQVVIKYLFPTIFETKNYAKYFLTIIGDILLKKNQVIYLISPQFKKIIADIEDISSKCLGINTISNQFVTKHHENHLYENYRLLKINSNFCNNIWKDTLKTIGLNLLCVAIHYSNRYESAELFLENKLEDSLKTYTLFLKSNKEEDIIDDFCDKFIIKSDTLNLNWKDIHFLWKEYLQKNFLYNIIYSTSLKQKFKNRYSFEEQSEFFLGITSKFIPKQKDFLNFWKNNIIVSNVEDFDDEIEIDEVCTCYKNNAKILKENRSITEEEVINILKHFYPDIVIFDDKYIVNVSFSSWNKIKDIDNFLISFIKYELLDFVLALISFDNIYSSYEKQYLINKKPIVSKRYFEKYINYRYSEIIVYDKFIPVDKLPIF